MVLGCSVQAIQNTSFNFTNCKNFVKSSFSEEVRKKKYKTTRGSVGIVKNLKDHHLLELYACLTLVPLCCSYVSLCFFFSLCSVFTFNSTCICSTQSRA